MSASGAMATSPGQLDSGFNPDADNVVWAVDSAADGTTAFGGIFTQVGGVARGRIAKASDAGAPFPGFAPGAGANAPVLAVATQPDGKVLIGGTFSQVDGVPRNLMARLNSDGSLDGGFDPGVTGPAFSAVEDIALQSDGRIVIGGSFTGVAGSSRVGLARLNPDGSLDTGFTADLDANQDVYGLRVLPDDAILIGGTFNTVGGVPREHVAKLRANGALDTTFAPAAGQDDYVYAIDGHPDGTVVIGGPFRQVAGVSRERIARLKPDGSLDMGFNPAADRVVRTVITQRDGKVLVGGDFQQIDGLVREHFTRLDADGHVDSTFAHQGFNLPVESMSLQPDGKAVVGGDFTSAGATPRNRIARVHATTPTAAPGGPSARAGDALATVSWSAVPGEIQSYTATATPGGRACTTSAAASCTVTGLTNGVAYTFRVVATNAFGNGPESSATVAVTPTAPASGAAPASGTAPASGAAPGKPAAARKKLAGTFRLNRRTRVGTTTGRVPTGTTRITQTARTGSATATQGFLEMARVKRAKGRCRVTPVRSKKTKKIIRRNYRCTITLSTGTWTITTTARRKAAVVAQGTRRVRVR